MKLVVDKESLVSVADAIRTKGNTTDELEFPNGFVDGINAIESGGGGTEEIENLIDQSGVLDSTDGTATEKVEQLIDKAEDLKALNEVTSKRLSFSGDYEGVQEPFVLPKHDFSSATNLSTFCNNSYVTDIPYYINSPNCTNISSAFSRTLNFKHMVGIDTSKVTNAYNCFYQSGIEEIDEPFDFSSITNTNYSPNFNQCNNLKKISFKENTLKCSMTFTSAVLSDEDEVDENGEIIRESSIKSILKGLAPVETTQTLTVHISVYDKMLDDKFFDLVSEAIDKGWEITA